MNGNKQHNAESEETPRKKLRLTRSREEMDFRPTRGFSSAWIEAHQTIQLYQELTQVNCRLPHFPTSHIPVIKEIGKGEPLLDYQN